MAMRSRRYVALLVFAAVIGVIVSVAAYFFLTLISKVTQWVYTDLPKGLGFTSTPTWWPLPVLLVAGLTVAAAIVYLPGTGGESPGLVDRLQDPREILRWQQRGRTAADEHRVHALRRVLQHRCGERDLGDRGVDVPVAGRTLARRVRVEVAVAASGRAERYVHVHAESTLADAGQGMVGKCARFGYVIAVR